MIKPLLALVLPTVALCFQTSDSFQRRADAANQVTALSLFGSSGSGQVARAPTSSSDRDKLAIASIKAALAKPKTPDFCLIECEFPPLAELNKLGDGSLRSAQQVDAANVQFCKKLIQSISPIPLVGPPTTLLLSAAASASFANQAKKAAGPATLHSLKDGLPNLKTSKDLCILCAPSSRNDYEAARQLAANGNPVVLVNGFAKDQKSVSPKATMAYYLKPLTYNSQVVGYLTRAWPSKWTTLDAVTKQVLGTPKNDNEILVRGTNTPDLRESGRLVQKSVDDRAIAARKQQQQR